MHHGLADTLTPEQGARILIGKMRGATRMADMARGINVYDLVRNSFGTLDESLKIREEARSRWPCIFLAHLSDEKGEVYKVAEYINGAGLNVYLDAEDPDLQTAVLEGNDREVTRFIERGITSSSHLLAFLTADTMTRTWWVPFEIGFAKRDRKKLACLKLKGVDFGDLAFLSILKCLEGIGDLNDYLLGVSRVRRSAFPLRMAGNWSQHLLLEGTKGGYILNSLSPRHPLEPYLDP